MQHMGASGHTVAGSGTADGSAFVAGTTDVLFIALQGADYTADVTTLTALQVRLLLSKQ